MTKVISGSTMLRIVAAGDYPTWRAGHTKDVGFTMGAGTSLMNTWTPYTPSDGSSPAGCDLIDAWGTLTSDGNKIYNGGGGGHAATNGHAGWQNPVLVLDLSVGSPAWATVDGGSVWADATVRTRRNKEATNSRPVGRHQYYSTHFVSGAHVSDGKDRIMLVQCYAAYGVTAVDNGTFPDYDPGQPRYSGGPHVDGFRIVDAVWDSVETWPDRGYYSDGAIVPIAAHPTNGRFYNASDHKVTYLDPSTKSWSSVLTTSIGEWNRAPCLIDTIRNKLVAILPCYTNASEQLRLERMDLGNYSVDTINLTDPSNNGFTTFTYRMLPYYWAAQSTWVMSFQQGAMVHDLDNDRYLLFRNSNNMNETMGFGDNFISVPLVAIDPDSGETTEIPTAMIPGINGGNTWCGRARFVPAMNCVVCYARFQDPMYCIPTLTG